VAEGYIQWQYVGDAGWNNLIELTTLVGPAGQNGTNGTDGKEVAFRVAEGYIQWQYTGDTIWSNLIQVATLVGETGEQGIGISSMEINLSGELIVTLTDDSQLNLGKIATMYTVIFLGFHNYVIDVQLIVYGQDAKAPNNPYIEGYMFCGWDNEFTNVTSNTIVSAIYALNQYTVVFDSNGGSLVPTLEYIAYGDHIPLTVPTKDGYKFEGWFVGQTVNDSQFTSNDVVTGDLTLYARWVKWLNIVTFDSDGGTPFDSQSILNGGKALSPGNPMKDGYSFLGWYYEDTKWVFAGYSVTENMTLRAQYDPIEYSLTYRLFGGIFGSAIVPTSYTIESETFGIPEPTKDGYVFSGWTYEGQDLPVRDVTIIQGSMGPLELMANWVDLSTLTYNATLTDTPTGYVINTIYFLTMYDDGSFLLIAGSIYSDGTITFSADYGTTKFLENNIVELDFVNEGMVTLYIIINGNSMSFCNEDGTPIEATEPTQEGAYSIGNFTSEELEIGYGYYDLSFYDNADELHSLYLDLYHDCQEFATLTIDYQAQDGSNLFNKYDMTKYGLSLEDGFKVIKVFLLDHPEYFWISTTFSAYGSLIDVFIIPEYQSYAARLVVENGLIEIIDELDSIISSDMSNLDIAYYLHDYVISLIDYAYELDGVTPQDEYWAHNIEGVVLSKGAVCEGYAESYKLLLDHFGIYNLLVTGESGGEKHLFNLVQIDGIFYVFDLTWDDPGYDEISITYFGMGYSSIIQTHSFDSSDSVGIDYLYHLPVISSEDITLVNLYYNAEDMGWYVSIDSAFEEMIDPNGIYEIHLLEYDRVGPLLMSYSTRVYDIPSVFPIVNCITIGGEIISLSNDDIGSGWYTMIPLSFDDNLYIMSNVIFRNVIINAHESTIYISSSQLTFLGANIIATNIVGDEGSILYLGERYGNGTEFFGRINVDVLDIVGTTLQFRGDSLEIDDLFRHNLNMGEYFLSGSLLLSGTEQHTPQLVKINRVHLDEVSELLNIQNVYNLEVTINEVIGLMAPSVLISVENLDYMPSITINGTINNIMSVGFISSTITVETDLYGKQVSIKTSKINITDYEGVILTIPQIDLSMVNIWQDGRNISNLFDKNEFGELLKVRDTYEEIVDGVLVNVTSSELLLDYVVPDSVNEIGYNAFIGCILSSIVIPEGVTKISEFAFQGQTYLSYVELPSTIISIGDFAFINTYATIYLNTGIESLSPYAFSEGDTLLIPISESDFSFELSDTNTQSFQILWNYIGMIDEAGYHYAVSSDGYAVLIGIDDYTDNIVLPHSVQGYELIYFASMVFYNSTIRQIILSNTLLAIPPRAFQNCVVLDDVVFESNSKIAYIGVNAFQGVELDSIIIPISVIMIGSSAFGYNSFNEIYDMIIYVEATAKPDGWEFYWVGNDKIPVIWGYMDSERST
jgi:uncharacterized repeat protein (TIGR02543 family)